MIARIKRSQLQMFLKDDEDAIRAFEALFENANAMYSMRPFKKTATLSASAAGTAVNIVDGVNQNETVYISGMILKVDGATAWTDATGTIVKIQDNSSVVGITIPKALLVGNAVLYLHSASVVLGDAITEGVGFTMGSRIEILADDNFTAGSDIKCTLFGYIGV